jgi:hypothetical protein
MTSAALLASALAIYTAAGIGVATAFVIMGADRMLSVPVSFTVGTRLLLFPGAALLWPYVLRRWLKTANRQ